MSLQVWLPLNGNTNNQGLLNVNPSSSSPTYTDGKIGKCLVSPNFISITSSEINYTQFSVAFWVKCKSGFSGDWKAITRLNTKNTGNGTSGHLRFEQASGSSYYRTLSTHNNASYDVDGGSTVYSTTADVWMHIVYTYDSNSGAIVTYLNGQIKEKRTGKTGGQLNGYLEIGRAYEGWVCDYRLYDHCLSPKEVKEIAKGLVLHYKLSGFGADNLCINSHIPNLSGGAGTSVYTYEIVDDDGLCSRYTCTTQGSGGRHYPYLPKGDANAVIGETYTWSMDIKASREFTCNIGHECGGTIYTVLSTEWKRYYHTWVFTDATYS